jgi:hypothetical protein
MDRCLGKTPGYVRYSGYDTPEEEAEYLDVLGPIWFCGDPIPYDESHEVSAAKARQP